MKTLDTHFLTHLKHNWSWFFALGILLVILGALAIAFSTVSTLFSVLYLGSFLCIVGVLEAIHAFKMHKITRFLLHTLLSVLYVIAGIYIFYNPLLNAVSLTFLLAWFFIISGIFKVGFSLVSNIPHPGWLMFNGAITALLGVLIWQQWPASGLWVLGMFLGIDTLFTGINWIILALAAKNIPVGNHYHV